MELTQIIDRKTEIRNLAQPATNVRQRIAQAAQDLSRAGTMAAHCEVANEALLALVNILYQRDEDKCPANVDRVTGRLLVPAPWGAAGWKRWGLRKWEAEVLRRILRERVEAQRRPLFDYSETHRYWLLNMNTYNSLRLALAYLQAEPIGLVEWRTCTDAYHKANRDLAQA